MPDETKAAAPDVCDQDVALRETIKGYDKGQVLLARSVAVLVAGAMITGAVILAVAGGPGVPLAVLVGLAASAFCYMLGRGEGLLTNAWAVRVLRSALRMEGAPASPCVLCRNRPGECGDCRCGCHRRRGLYIARSMARALAATEGLTDAA